MNYKIAVFPGDGVCPELINEGIKVIEKAAELDKFEIEFIRYPYGAEHYLETKELLAEKVLKEIKNSCNAIYCGTFDSSVREINGMTNFIKNYFDQSICLRPIKLFPSVESRLAGKTHNDIDFTLIRENSEEFYIGMSGKAKNGKSRQQLETSKGALKAKFGIEIEAKGNELAYQIGILSRKGCERAIKYGFEYAKMKGKGKITSVDKANVLEYYSLWRESFDRIAKEYEDINHEFELIDSTVINFIRQPEKYSILVAPNMFGDILSDLGTILQGGLSFAARGSINPEGISMFDPIHGSAPKLKEKGIVNPIATIWAGALMLENIGQKKSSDLIIMAIEAVLKEQRTRTLDLDGNNTTSEMTTAIIDKFVELHD